MSVLEAPSCGHWCEALCAAATCDCPPCDCADCKRRRRRAETQPIGALAPVKAERRRPVQLAFSLSASEPYWAVSDNDDGRDAAGKEQD